MSEPRRVRRTWVLSYGAIVRSTAAGERIAKGSCSSGTVLCLKFMVDSLRECGDVFLRASVDADDLSQMNKSPRMILRDMVEREVK